MDEIEVTTIWWSFRRCSHHSVPNPITFSRTLYIPVITIFVIVRVPNKGFNEDGIIYEAIYWTRGKDTKTVI